MAFFGVGGFVGGFCLVWAFYIWILKGKTKEKDSLLECPPLSAGTPINAFEQVIQFQRNFTIWERL